MRREWNTLGLFDSTVALMSFIVGPLTSELVESLPYLPFSGGLEVVRFKVAALRFSVLDLSLVSLLCFSGIVISKFSILILISRKYHDLH